jgi:tyrosyl-tRNA synthetase
MYGKVMSISDEMMWRYYELLTDLQVAEIEKMKQEAHPMQAKKELARRIVADFHSAEAAAKAGEDWAKQFQKNEIPEEVEEVQISLAEILRDANSKASVPLARLLVECGLAESMTDASRKIKQEAVRVDNRVHISYHLMVPPLPARFVLRVGRRVKAAVLNE